MSLILKGMDTISLVLSDSRFVVTLTSDHLLELPPFVETPVLDGIQWADLYASGVLDGNDLSDAGCEAFGLPVYDRYSEVFAHITLIDPTIELYAVSRSHGCEVLGYATLDVAYCLTQWWHAVPEDLTRDDLTCWGPAPDGSEPLRDSDADGQL